ncbi:MAG: hypothetical protein OSA99_01410 [Acidimicrobiales bacterium]|nr:hypothetical protein [Acidimicrobiales bacterium]
MKSLRLAVVVIALVAAACGDDTSDIRAGSDDGATSDTPAATATIPADTVYEATATVLESPGHGPQLCLGGVAESYPPQCGGPDIVGWDWSTVEAESAGGTTWGTYSVTGTWDGETFTLTDEAEPDGFSDSGPSATFDTPCDEPEGGWQVVDGSTATQAGQDAAIAYAQAQPEFAGVWVDQSINPGTDELGMNDPAMLILNVRFTGDVDRHEAELRERFGGSLCVSEAEHTETELRAIQQDVFEELDGFYASTDVVRGVVEIGVIVADPAVQADLDDRYGDGVVELRGALQPVE